MLKKMVCTLRSVTMQSGILLTLLLLVLSSAWAQNPVPSISTPLFPQSLAPGGPSFVLTVDGSGFVASSMVEWNGAPLPTTFLSGRQLKANVPSANIASPGTAWITVSNGGGASNVGYFEITNATTSVSFNQSFYATGQNPDSIAAGDFNGDGKLDSAITNTTDGTVSILLGNGEGTFQPAVPYAVGKNPLSVTVGDFSGDCKLDLAVTNAADNTVSILLGNGDGTFTISSGPRYQTNAPFSVAVGDFNGDGRLDLAVANFDDNTVSILLGNGDGTFATASGSPIAAGSEPFTVVVGDFNGDGSLDLAVTNELDNTVSVLLGKGDGTFLPQTAFPTSSTPGGVVAGDFNGDGRMDLAVANYNSNDVAILLQPTPAPPPGGSDTTEILSLAAGTGLVSTGGQSPTLSLNTSYTDGRYLQLTGGTLTGGLLAPSFSGSGANLTNLSPGNLLPGTAGINITGNAATATMAASATNSIALGGVGPGGYAPSSGSPSYIQNNSGSAQTANLNISGNAGIGGNASVTGSLATTGPLNIGGTGTPIKGHTSIQVNRSFPALKGGACASANFALGGAADGDTIALGVPSERMSANATVIYAAWVSAANTVTVQACDVLGTQKTAGTGSIRIDLWKH